MLYQRTCLHIPHIISLGAAAASPRCLVPQLQVPWLQVTHDSGRGGGLHGATTLGKFVTAETGGNWKHSPT